MTREALRLSDVTLMEQGTAQLQGFSLDILCGEIMGLLPMNGHGLTALIDLVRGNLPLEFGYVYYQEELVNSWRAPRVHDNRIAVISSVSSLVDGLTVADNIFVLRPGFRAWLIRPGVLVRQVQPVLDALGVHIDADAYVDTLTVFERVVVELVKAIVAGCRLIILREIGAMLSDPELTRLHAILRRYAREGISFLYIGFHYEELVQICDRTAVYSNGRVLKILRPQDGELPYEERYVRRVREQMGQQEPVTGDEPVLLVRELSAGRMRGLSLYARPGDCVVVQDLQNQIFDDLIATLTGERAIERGEIRLAGRPFAPGVARDIAILRERPDESMIFPQLSYLDNLCMTVDHRLPEIWLDARMRAGIRKEWAQRVGDEVFDLTPAQLTRRQRYDLVFQRILLQRPRVVFCIQPFKGADVRLRMHIWELLKALLNQGIAVIILAVNLADTFTLATRLIRVEQGTVRCYEKSEFDQLPFTAPWLQLYKRPADTQGE